MLALLVRWLFDGSDYTRKTLLELYFDCGPLKKSKWKVKNVGNIKTKTDTKS